MGFSTILGVQLKLINLGFEEIIIKSRFSFVPCFKGFDV